MDFSSRPNGPTKADLKYFGKTPELSNKFTIQVIIGAIKSMRWSMRWDGTGSNKQVDFGEVKIHCLSSSTDTSLNDENEGDDLACRKGKWI